MSATLVLVIAGDQLAKDIITSGNPAAALSSATGKSVKIVDVTSPNRVRGGQYLGTQKTASYIRSELSLYTIKVRDELAKLPEWESAGIWWAIGISDAIITSDREYGGTSHGGTFEGEMESLLAWNPFNVDTKTFVSIMPNYPVSSLGQELTTLGLAIINSGIRAAAATVSATVIEDPLEYTREHIRYKKGDLDYGFSASGATALAQAFAAANAPNLGGTGTGENDHVVPITQTVTTYTTFTQTVTRNRLAGLEGQMVSILADGVAYEYLQVGADGTLNLPVAAKKITVGLPYTSALAPMPVDTDNNDGSTLGKRRGYGRCLVRVHRSMGGKYGASRSGDLYNEQAWKVLDLYDIPFASQMYRENEGVFSGDIEFVLPSGQDEDTTIWLVHDKPYPFRLVSIMAEVDFGEQ